MDQQSYTLPEHDSETWITQLYTDYKKAVKKLDSYQVYELLIESLIWVNGSCEPITTDKFTIEEFEIFKQLIYCLLTFQNTQDFNDAVDNLQVLTTSKDIKYSKNLGTDVAGQ